MEVVTRARSYDFWAFVSLIGLTVFVALKTPKVLSLSLKAVKTETLGLAPSMWYKAKI